MPIDALWNSIDSVTIPFCGALFVFGLVLAITGIWRPNLLWPGVKLMAAPVFLLPLLAELSWLVHSPFVAANDSVLWFVMAISSLALIAFELVCLAWIIRFRPPKRA
jgi:hypothetical protein